MRDGLETHCAAPLGVLAQTNARLADELGVAQRAAAEHARTAGEQATHPKPYPKPNPNPKPKPNPNPDPLPNPDPNPNSDKAFIFLDEKGEGWLPLEDFESALLLVLSPGADGQHEEQRGEQSGEHAQQAKQEDQVMMAAQVKDLVASLKRSHMVNPLKDLQSPEIDYNMFIQSFTVIDTLLDQP